VKPANILISFPDNRNNVRALISDFGLCKKVENGKVSMTNRASGTEGWIAPEILRDEPLVSYKIELIIKF
jgi:serine/threonine-protein kinase/endoribonuclease IRE1